MHLYRTLVLKTFVTILFSLGLWFFSDYSIHAATYYIDNSSGSDSYTGTNITSDSTGQGPWKTISKINSLSCGSGVSQLNAGDSVLFKKGEVWREQLIIPCSGSDRNPILFGAYGDGNINPIIDGSIPVLNWNLY